MTFATHKDADFANDLLELAALHNSIAVLFKEYNPGRRDFGEKAIEKGSVTVEGQVASFSTSDSGIRLRAVQLRDLSELIEMRIVGGAPHVAKVASVVTTKLSKILNDRRFNAVLTARTADPPAP